MLTGERRASLSYLVFTFLRENGKPPELFSVQAVFCLTITGLQRIFKERTFPFLITGGDCFVTFEFCNPDAQSCGFKIMFDSQVVYILKIAVKVNTNRLQNSL